MYVNLDIFSHHLGALVAGIENSFGGGIPFGDTGKAPRGIGDRAGFHAFDGLGGDVPIFRII
jgi:hypothetical protein